MPDPSTIDATGASPHAAASASVHLLIGGFGDAFASYRFETASGRIVPQSRVATPAERPSWLVYRADRQHLFAVSEQASGTATPAGRVASFQRADVAGLFTRISEQDSGGDEPTHAVTSPDGRYLLVANYASAPDPGGSLAVLPIDREGRLGPLTQRLTHPASGVHAERQASSHVHGASWPPDGRHVFVADLGADRVYVYRYAPERDPAQPLQPAEPPFCALPPGSGPRHLVFSADGEHAYLVLEMAAEVAVLAHRHGQLSLRARHPLAPAGFVGRGGGGAVHLSPDGAYLYVSDRGENNQLAVFAVDRASGALSLRQHRPSEGKEPREFTLSPDGRFVLVANKHADQVSVLERDPASGELGRCLQVLAFPTPSIVVFLPD